MKEEAEWKYTLSCSDDLESAIDGGDLEEVIEALKGAYDELVDQELFDEGRRDKVFSALEQIDIYDDGAEAKVEKKLDQFYNVCDKLGVKISFNESLKESALDSIRFSSDDLKRKAQVLYDNGFITKNQLISGGVSEKDVEDIYDKRFDKNGKERRKSRYGKLKEALFSGIDLKDLADSYKTNTHKDAVKDGAYTPEFFQWCIDTLSPEDKPKRKKKAKTESIKEDTVKLSLG